MSNTESSIPPDAPRFFKSVWVWLAAVAAVLTMLVTIVNLSGQLNDGARKLFASSPEHPSVSPPISAQGHYQLQEEVPVAEPQRAPSNSQTKFTKCRVEADAKIAIGDFYDPAFFDRCLGNP